MAAATAVAMPTAAAMPTTAARLESGPVGEEAAEPAAFARAVEAREAEQRVRGVGKLREQRL